MILGLVAMPAIMRLVAPAVGAITAGAGFGGAVGATAGTVAQGAMMMRMYGGSSGGGRSGGNTPTGSPPAGSPPAGSPPAGSSPAGSSPAGNLPAAGNSTMTVSSSGGAAASVAGPVAVGLAAGAQVLSSTQMIVKSGAEGSMNVGSGSDTTTLGW